MPKRIKTARCILYNDDSYLLAIHSSFRWRKHQRWGLPGGQVEWRESPEQAVSRELLEELDLYVGELTEIGDYHYKRALHRVLAAPCTQQTFDYDSNELVDVRWYSSSQIAEMATNNELHAGYEWQAIQILQSRLEAGA